MATEKQTIRVLTEPTIELDDLEAQDMEDGTSEASGGVEFPLKHSKQYGAVFPYVQINSYLFTSGQITSLELNCSGEIPSIMVTFNITDKSFFSTSFPKDGDLMSIFIRSKNDLFKPVRNDYEITSVSVSPREGGGENTPEDMTVLGVLRIPGYFATKCFSKRGTSMNTVHKVAADLGLGFASNEVDTDDEQAWICPNDKVNDFIYDVVNSSWKDENSFFTYFIDHYYYLNFVNVEPMFSEKTEIEESLINELITNDYGEDSSGFGDQSGKVILSNMNEIAGTNFHIRSYYLRNSSASINNLHGYRRFAMFYDALIKEPVKIFSDPLTTDGSESKQVLLKGRPGEDFYKQQVQTKWMGVHYGENGENCHEKYNIARITNFQNNVHLDKLNLIVELESVNFNLRRMQSIPVIIVIKKDFSRKKINEPIDEDQEATPPNSDEPNRTKSILDSEELPFTLDKTLSGNYVIKDIIYTYRKGLDDDAKFRQECVLVRREWPTPPQTY